jgi:putative aldouronate transport system permease protein
MSSVSRKSRIRFGADDVTVASVSYLFAGVFALLCFIPFVYVLAYSITPYDQYLLKPFNLIPSKITFAAYRDLLRFRYIITGYRNTIFISFVGTALSMLLLVITAYPLTKKHLKGRNFYLTLWIITMFFSGGMIPNYLLVRQLNMINSLWSQILPPLLGAWNIIMMKNYMNGLPESIEEAAHIDGASAIQVLFRVLLPLCLPIMAALSLFTIVGLWNSYFSAILYMTKRDMWPLQLVLREIVVMSSTREISAGTGTDEIIANPFTMKMAAIIVATLPIMCVYPFLQKYFMHGLVVGGVKE